MRVSLNQIKKFINNHLPSLDELVLKINQQLGGVEKVIDLKSQYQGAVIVRVTSCQAHPDADKLSVTMIDDGGVVPDVPRDDNGHIQVVCGAPNVRADMYAVWLPPGATVPSSLNEGETPFILDSRKLRGVLSHGMLAAADELAIGSDHAGIVELNQSDLKSPVSLRPGLSLAETFELDDTIIEIENKMFTHRPDLFGQLGVAREIATIIQGVPAIAGSEIEPPFTNPDWYLAEPDFNQSASQLALKTFNTAEQGAPRFMAVALDQVKVQPSPFWLQAALVAMGSKPVNNIVDITNYVMLITAQPTHAYDYDKLDGQTIGVRRAQAGERVELLNGKTYQLDASDVVIADAQQVIGLAGIMGGQASQVTETTTRVVLESANFDMYTVRRSSMRHGLFTDALTRFNKGQSVWQVDRVLSYMMQLMADHAGAVVASPVDDCQSVQLQSNSDISVSSDFINQRLGSDLSQAQIAGLLQAVNFIQVSDSPETYRAPFWRTDIELAEDIVEEIGRLYGFEKLPRHLPLRLAEPTAVNQTIKAKSQLRQALAKFGANETLSYSFTNHQTMTAAGQDPNQAYQIKNALSPDLQFYRLSILPSLLEKVHPNIKAGQASLAMFEIGKFHDKINLAVDNQGVPIAGLACDIVMSFKQPQPGAAYYAIRQLVEDALADINIAIRTEAYTETESDNNPGLSVFEPSRLAAVYEVSSGQLIGYIGELRQSVKKAFKLPDYSAGATLDMAAITKLASGGPSRYRTLSRYPSVERDLTVQLSGQQSFSQLTEVIWQAHQSDEVAIEITPVDIYQPESAETKNITLHIKLTPASATLDGEQANRIMQTLTTAVTETLAAKIV